MSKPRDPEDPEVLRRRDIYEKAKSFEKKVADLFALQGYRTTLDYKRDDMQYDIRLETRFGVLPIHVLVECKDLGEGTTQKDIREFASKVEYATRVDKLPYQAILVSSSGVTNNAHEAAKNLRVELTTYDQLLCSLVDLGPVRDAAIRAFQGTPLETLYVEQEVVFDRDIRPGQAIERKSLTGEVIRWLNEPSGTFLSLLGDFGCGKTSFSKRLACELAQGEHGDRTPVLIDLREGGSTTVTLESLLTHCFQRLSSQPFNPQALLQLNREGYLVLIFDGFDETIAYTEPGRYVDNLRQILRAAEGKAKVLMTCRTHYFRDRPEVLRQFGKAPAVVSTQGATSLYEEIQNRPGAEVGYVLEFRDEQISEYLQKALPPEADWQAFREQIRKTYNLENLAERPFLLEIIVKTLPLLLERKGKITLADLYESYCESWFSHTDFRLTLTRERKVALVEYLARLIWDSPENRVHYHALYESAARFFEDRQLSVYDKERVDYEVRTALFLHRDAEGYYSFIHRSFLEFFIARSLRDGLREEDVNCLALRRLTREVAFFLEFWPEAARIQEMAGWVLEAEYQPQVSENALLLLYFHAQTSLGPLVGPQSGEEPDLLEIRRVFSVLRFGTLHLEGADLEGVALPGIDLSDAGLDGAKLSRADLRQACLDGACLVRADLGFVDFRKGSAEGADFSGADLNHLDAQDGDFRKADLQNVNLSFARLTRADLRDAELTGVKTVGTAFLQAQGADRAILADTAGGSKAQVLDLRWQTGHADVVASVAWSPKGRCVATGSYDGTVKVWDVENGRLLNTLAGHDESVNSVSWSPDGTRLASGSDDETVMVWEAASGRLLNVLAGHDNSVFSVSWSPDGKHLASGSRDQTVMLWDAASGRLLNTLAGHDNSVFSVSWSPDGKRLASGSYDKTVKLWDPSSGRVLNTLTGHDKLVLTVSWSPDGTRLATGSDDKTVKLWELSSGRLLNTLTGHDNLVFSVSWSPDGTRLASGSSDETVKVWEASSGRLLNTLAGHDDAVNSVSWSPGGMRLASGSSDETVKVWEASSGWLLNTLSGPNNWVNSVSWSPDGTRLASGSDDETVMVWEAASGRLLNALAGHDNSVFSVSWSPDGTRLATGSRDETMKVWEPSSGRVLNTLADHDNLVFSVSWSPDGTRLASGSRDQTVKVWEASSGRLLNTLSGHDDFVRSVAWSVDGARLASGSWDKTVKVWEASSGRLVNTLSGHDNSVLTVSWSPDGTRLASGSYDRTVKVWEASSGRLLNTLSGHDNSVLTVSWSPDGTRLASGSEDKTVRIWDTGSGKELRVLAVPSEVSSLSWSSNGRRLVLSWLSFLEIWDIEADPPRPLVRLYSVPGGSGVAATPDGYVFGPPEALEWVRFGDGWALYDVTDVPERVSEERVRVALKG
jgi:WD40 repeat protein